MQIDPAHLKTGVLTNYQHSDRNTEFTENGTFLGTNSRTGAFNEHETTLGDGYEKDIGNITTTLGHSANFNSSRTTSVSADFNQVSGTFNIGPNSESRSFSLHTSRTTSASSSFTAGGTGQGIASPFLPGMAC